MPCFYRTWLRQLGASGRECSNLGLREEKPGGPGIVVQGIVREWGHVSESVNRHLPSPMGPLFSSVWKLRLQCPHSDRAVLRWFQLSSGPGTRKTADRRCAGSILYHQNAKVAQELLRLFHERRRSSIRQPFRRGGETLIRKLGNNSAETEADRSGWSILTKSSPFLVTRLCKA